MNREVRSSARQRRLSAVHEAGHAVIARALGVEAVASIHPDTRPEIENHIWGGITQYSRPLVTPQEQRRCGIAGAVAEWCWNEIIAGKPFELDELILDLDPGLNFGSHLGPNLSVMQEIMSVNDRVVDGELFDFDTAPTSEKMEWYDAMHWAYDLLNPFTGKLWAELQREARRLIVASRPTS